MMGRQDDSQERLFYSFNLEEHVPQDHLLRHIDRCLDLSGFREHMADYYSHTGRPSIDPELMIRMLVVGYSLGIRSERRLCEEIHLNLAYRWFCRLSLEDKVPNHSTFSKNRHGRFRDSDALRVLFEQVVQRCIDDGLVGGEGFAVDASIVRADASRQKHHEDDDDWRGGGTRAVREYLEILDSAEMRSFVSPKKVSQTDPTASWTSAPGGPAFYGYCTNYLADIEAGIIVDVDATRVNRSREVDSTKAMIERVKERFEIKPDKMIGDTAYGTGEMLNWMVNEQDIEPHVPVWQKSPDRPGLFALSEFKWDEQAGQYVCPAGKSLQRSRRKFTRPRIGVNKDNTIMYSAAYSDCANCSLKQQCTPMTPVKRIRRSIYESSRQRAREIATTPGYAQSRKDRKKVEMLFAHMKRILKVDRLRLRGMNGARDEFLLTATAQNLRRMAHRSKQKLDEMTMRAAIPS